MADNQTPNTNDAPATSSPKKRRRWPLVVGGIVIVLVLLVLLLPTIASMGFVRSIVLGKVNQNLNGTVTIDDWSLGWTSGITARGIKVADQTGEILKIDKLSTDLTVLSAVRGKYLKLGDVVIDGLHFALKVDEQGNTNFQKLVKTTASVASGKPEAKNESSPLPDISAVVKINNGSGTIEKAGMPEKVAVDLNGVVKVPNINQAIDDQLALGLAVGNGQKGTIDLNGTADIAENYQLLKPNQMAINQAVVLKNIDLTSLRPFLPAASIDTVQGLTNGDLKLALAPGKPGTVEGNVTTTGVLVSGPALKGDKFQTQTLALNIPATEVVTSEQAAGVSIRASQPITIKMDQGTVELLANASVASLQNLAGGKAPGQPGTVQTAINLDLGALARQLPHVMALQPGVVVDQGKLVQSGTVQMTTEQASTKQHLELSGIAGRNTERNNAPIALQPIVLDLATNILPGKAMPDLRNVVLTLTSGFANVDVKGESIAAINGRAQGDLARAQQELGQLFAFPDGLQLQGLFDANVASRGDLAAADGPVALNATANLRNLRVAGLQGVQPIQEESAVASVNGTLTRANGSVTGVDKLVATARTGGDQNPVIDLNVVSSVQMQGGKTTVPAFNIQRLFVDLARAQQKYAALLKPTTRPAGQPVDELNVASGTLTVTGSGSWDGTTANLANFAVTPQNVTLVRNAAGQQQPVLNNYSTQVALAGTVAMKPDATTASLTQFAIDDKGQVLTLRKVGDAPVQVSVPKQGTAQASGRFELAANLAALDKLASAFTGAKAQPGSAGQITSGVLNGTADLATAQDGITLAGDFTARELSVASGGNNRTIDRENVTLAVRGKAAPDLASAVLNQLSLKSSFLTADGSATLQLKKPASTQPASGIEMVKAADLTVAVPDVPRTMALVDAFSAPAAPAPAQPGVAPTPPMVWTSGNAQVKVKLSRDADNAPLVADLQQLTATNLGFTRGPAQYSFDPVSLKATAAVTPAADGTVRDLEVRQLAGNLGSAAQIALSQPISIKNMPGLLASLGTATPEQRQKAGAGSAAGGIQATGDLAKLKQLLDALGGTPPQNNLAGQFKLDQKFTTQGQAIASQGDVTVTNLVASADPTKVFKEDNARISNDVTLDRASDTLAIRALSFNMQSSKALDLNLTGSVKNLSAQRNLDNVKADLSYDAAKLWTLMMPFLAPETQKSLAAYQVAGAQKHTITVSGAYPSGVTFDQAVKQLVAQGSIGVDTFQGSGVTIQKLSPAFTLKNGMFSITATDSTAAPNAPAGTTLNGGAMTLTGITLDLGNPAMRVSTPPNLPLVKGAALNAELMGAFGKHLTPLLSNPQQAAGVADVTVVECDGLALAAFTHSEDLDKPAQVQATASAFDDWKKGLNVPQGATATTPARVPSGRAEILVSVQNVEIANELVATLVNVLSPDTFDGRSLRGEIKEGRIIIENGQVTSDLKLAVGPSFALGFNGNVDIATKRLSNFAVNVPTSLLREVRNNKQLAQFMPDVIPIAINGTTQRYQLDLSGSVNKLVAEAMKKAVVGGALGALTGQGQNPQNAQPGQPQQQGGNDLGGLLNDVLGGNRNREKGGTQQQQQQQQQPRGPASEAPAGNAGQSPAAQAPAQPQQQPAQTPPPGAISRPPDGAAGAAQEAPAARGDQREPNVGDIIGGLLAGSRDREKGAADGKAGQRKAATKPATQPGSKPVVKPKRR